jgi:peptidoglycan/LPS O-acetylase OafA/YrhL
MRSSDPMNTTPSHSIDMNGLRHAAVFDSLDRWRIVLALMVVLMHVNTVGLIDLPLPALTARLAHDSVVGFFVISGYSVMHAASRAQGDARSFLIGRWSRLLSLVVPGLLLTLALDALGKSLRPDLYPLWMYDHWWTHLAVHVLFIGEVWERSFPAFSNVPYWSLGYEAWYYVMLAVAMACAGRPVLRAVSLAALAVLLGPRIVLLLPCWLMGVWAWWRVETSRAQPLRQWPDWAWPGALLLIVYALWAASPLYFGLRELGETTSEALIAAWGPYLRLSNSRWFSADWITALLFTAMILLRAATVRQAIGADSPRTANPAWIGALAFHSFGIYLLHFPLLLCAKALDLPALGLPARVATLLEVVILCVLVSMVCSRSRSGWQRLLGWRLAGR